MRTREKETEFLPNHAASHGVKLVGHPPALRRIQPVDEEDSVEMIHLVLNAAGKKAGGFFCFPFPVNILIADNDIGITGSVTKEFRIGYDYYEW